MDFGVIKEIGSAFLVGSTGLLIIEAYLYFCTGWTATGFFRLPIGIDPVPAVGRREKEGTKGEPHGNIQIGAFISIATIAGLLCQSAFQGLIDNATFPVVSIPRLLSKTLCTAQAVEFGCLPTSLSKDGIRASVFYEREINTVGGTPTIQFKATNLAVEYVNHGLLKACDGHVSSTASQFAANIAQNTSTDDSDCVKHLYYTAKNWSARQQTLYDELMRIHARIEFERAFSLITISLLPWASVFILNMAALRYAAIIKYPSGQRSTATRWQRFARKCHPDEPQSATLRVGIALAIFAMSTLSMWVVSHWLLQPTAGSRPVFASGKFALVASAAVTCVLIAASSVKANRPVGWLRSCGLVGLLILVLLIGHLLGFYAYVADEQEFSKRSFGDFESHVVMDKADGASPNAP